MLHGFEKSILADSLQPPQDQRMVDLLMGLLYAMGEPCNDVLCVLIIDLADVFKPESSLGGIALNHFRRSVKVEACATTPLNPAALRNELITYQHRLSGRPSHLLNRLIAVDPGACFDRLVLMDYCCNPG